MQRTQQRSLKPRALPDRGTHNRQRPVSSSSVSSTSSRLAPPSTTASIGMGKDGENVDKLLFKNFADMDKKSNPAFTRRASMLHTPAPPLVKKVSTTISVQGAKNISAKKPKSPSAMSSSAKKPKSPSEMSSLAKKVPNGVRSSATKLLVAKNLKKEREELALLQGQVDELEKKLVEKEEALKLAQNSIDQMSTVNEALEDVKHQLEDKEMVVMSASSELNEAKDDIGEIDMDTMEREIATYMSALAAAKENPDERLLDTVAQGRLRLQALVLSS